MMIDFSLAELELLERAAAKQSVQEHQNCRVLHEAHFVDSENYCRRNAVEYDRLARAIHERMIDGKKQFTEQD